MEFGIGYQWRKNESNLIVAQKQQVPNEEAGLTSASQVERKPWPRGPHPLDFSAENIDVHVGGLMAKYLSPQTRTSIGLIPNS